MCSFNETFARKLTLAYPEEFVNYNKSFFSRIYPAGSRVNSSNYNPQDFWDCGCQMGRYRTEQISTEHDRCNYLFESISYGKHMAFEVWHDRVYIIMKWP